jgi:hypothetical protein
VHCSGQEHRDKTGHLANDKLPFRLIEIMYRNFEVELERIGNKQIERWVTDKVDSRERDPCGYDQLVVGECVSQRISGPRPFSTYRYHNENHGMGRTYSTAAER